MPQARRKGKPAARAAAQQPNPDGEALRAFVNDLHDVLDVVVNDYPGLLGTRADRFTAAWAEVEPRFATLDERRWQREELDSHGLTGASLALKLELFGSTLDDFVEELEQQDDAERYWRSWESRLRGSGWIDSRMRSWVVRRRADVKRAGRNLLKGRLAKVLDAADVILDSLAQAVPVVGGAAGAISEFKDAAIATLGGPEEIDSLSGGVRKATGEADTPLGRLKRRKQRG